MEYKFRTKSEFAADVVVIGGGTAGCTAAISAKKGIELKNISHKELCDSLMTINAGVPKKNDFLS